MTGALAAFAFAGTWLAASPVAHAASPYLEVPTSEEVQASPAYRYANMTNEEAFAELDRRGVPYVREAATTGVRAPIRFSGPLHGVDIHSSLPAEERATSMFEILDARLALSIDDFCVVLARHDVNEVVHYTMYRPNVAAPGTAIATKAAPKKGDPKKGDPKATDPKGKAVATKSANAKTDGRARPTKDGHAPKRRASLDGKAQKEHARRAGVDESKHKDVDLPEKTPLVFEEASEDLAKGTGPRPAARAPAKRSAAPAARADAPADRAQAKPRAGKSAKKRIMMTTNEDPHARWAPPGTRHPAGLAIDVGILKKIDGTYLNVAQHFHGKIGDKTCGTDVPEADTKEARELRAIVCEAHDAGIFTYALTPNFNADHADHFHLEIKPGVRWFLYH